MFKKTFVLGAFVVALFLVAQPVQAAGWKAYPSITSYNFEGIDMYESGNSSFGVIVGGGGKIYVSTDGGETWLLKTSGVTSILYDVQVLDLTTAWAVGANGRIVKTTNSGSTWIAQSSGTTATLYDILATSSTGYVVGAGGVVLYTTNGGTNWTVKSSGSAFDLFAIEGVYTGSAALSDSPILVSGGAGIILSSLNHGDSWTAQLTDAAAKLSDLTSHVTSTAVGFGISWIMTDTLLSVGGGGVIVRSTNGGTDWAQINSGTTVNLTAVKLSKLSSGSRGWAVGANGTILQTADKGVTWVQETSGTTVQLNDVAILTQSPLRVYAVGAGGKLLRYDETPPAAPGNLTKTTADTDTTPTFTWSAANDQITPTLSAPVSKYEYSLDSGAYTDNGSNLTMTIATALSSGSHTMAVRAVDAASNASDPTTLTFNISAPDTTAPTVSTVTPTTAIVGVYQTYSVTYSDAGGVSSCKLFIDGDTTFVSMTISEASSGTATKSLSFSTAGNHTLQAKCTDGSANTNQTPAATTITVTASDTVAPTGNITINNGVAATKSVSVSLKLYCSDNVSCASAQVAVDGTADTESWVTYPSGVSSTNVSATLSSGDGTKTVAVKFKDGAGNISVQYADTIILDTTSPSTVSYISKAAPDTDTTPTFSWGAASDNMGVQKYVFRIDSSPHFTIIGNVLTWTLESISVGAHTFEIKAVDAAGNESSYVSYSFNVVAPTEPDATAPTGTVVISNNVLVTKSTSVALTLTCDDNITCTQMRFSDNGSSWTDWESFTVSKSWTLFGGDGTKTVYVQFRDAAGNVNATTISDTITLDTTISSGGGGGGGGGGTVIDTAAPSIPSGLTLGTPESDNTPTIIWSASADNIGVIAYDIQLDSGNFIDVGTALTYTTAILSDDSHTFNVRARDAANNMSSLASLTFTIKTTAGGGGAAPTTIVTTKPPFSLEQMASDAQLVASGDLAALMSGANITTCQMSITAAETKAVSVFGAIANSTVKSAIINFTACGTISTLHLGAGERLGVVNSYKSAFGKLPSVASEWNDVTKIANGRFPGETSSDAETHAKITFKKIYKRDSNIDQQNDKAAVNVMAYGLRPLPRNLSSEAAAIKIFKAIFKYAPVSATDWDAVRAIAYSGAKQ